MCTDQQLINAYKLGYDDGFQERTPFKGKKVWEWVDWLKEMLLFPEDSNEESEFFECLDIFSDDEEDEQQELEEMVNSFKHTKFFEPEIKYSEKLIEKYLDREKSSEEIAESKNSLPDTPNDKF